MLTAWISIRKQKEEYKDSIFLMVVGLMQEQDGGILVGEFGFDAYPFGSCM